jgi:hypothetical protein
MQEKNSPFFAESCCTPALSSYVAPVRPEYAADAANKILLTQLLQLGRMTATV